MASEGPGAALRRAREARGLSIEDVSRTTKIGRATLIAIEDTDIAHLPAAIYTRGFVKAYAHEVGLPPDHTADVYLSSIAPPAVESPPGESGTPGGLTPHVAHDTAARGESRALLSAGPMRAMSRLTTLAAVVGLIVYVLYAARQGDEGPPVDTVDKAPVSDAAPASRDEPIDSVSGDALAALAGPLQIELVPQGPCWLVITVDGERVLAKLLQAGDRHTVEASDEVLLRVGDPGALSFSINGHAGRTLGAPGQPVDVRITKDNFREFLDS